MKHGPITTIWIFAGDKVYGSITVFRMDDSTRTYEYSPGKNEYTPGQKHSISLSSVRRAQRAQVALLDRY